MPSSRTSTAIDLLISLDRDSSRSLHHQLEESLRDAIRSGRLAGGVTLPSSRALAEQLGVARGVVVEAYEQLIAECYLLSRAGGSTRVAQVPTRPERAPITQAVSRAVIDLRPGRPDVTEFPRVAWSRAARRVLNEAPADRFTYLDGVGVPELRVALADYLGRARGAATHADDIVISSGFMQGLHLIGATLAATGARIVAVEEPFDPAYRATLDSTGLVVHPVPVDRDGLDVDALRASGADAVVVTPAHQFPTGAVLSPERRADILAWARDRGGIIIEDDYDAEFRYDRDPVGALQGLDPEHVIYAGTASKSIAPGLRLGWLAAPSRLTASLTQGKKALDDGSAALDQLILADVIERGVLDRHLRRMRALYRARRDLLLGAMQRLLPDWETVGASAGLHVLAYLPRGVDEARLVSEAAAEGVRVEGLAFYRTQPSKRSGVVFGYGAVDERRIERAVTLLARLASAQSN